MSKTHSPLPIFRADKFEFAGREIPRHQNRIPKEEERDSGLWAVEGVLAVGREERILLAANIPDEDSLQLLMSARFGRLSRDHPHLDLLDGNEVGMLLPKDVLQPVYEEGARRVFDFGGEIASSGAGIRIEPVPLAA